MHFNYIQNFYTKTYLTFLQNLTFNTAKPTLGLFSALFSKSAFLSNFICLITAQIIQILILTLFHIVLYDLYYNFHVVLNFTV